MKLAGVVSLFLIVGTMLGCAVGESGTDESLEQTQAAQIKQGWMFCIRDRSDLPDGHNIDSWLIECFGGGGDVICSGDTPMCCKGQSDGSRACSVDPGDVVRSAVDVGEGPVIDTVAQDSGGKLGVAGQTDSPGTLSDVSLDDKAPLGELDLGSLARTKGEDLEKCLHSCPTEPGKVEGCRRNCMCRTGHRPMSDCDLIDLFQ
jgi:hypothetical protein